MSPADGLTTTIFRKLTKGWKCVKVCHIMEHVLIGEHPSIQKIRELIALVSHTAYNVLLTGETGTGKEVVARLLYDASSRRGNRFVKVNCAALPLRLLESELFGHEKGAFTGADRSKPGKFEIASGGVIFLDEIGDMPLVLQAKLLQVVQSGEFNRLGGTADLKVNAWVISSTNHDLDQDIKQGAFREDLFYRLNIIRAELPPLRERKEDIKMLTNHFIEKYERDLNVENSFYLKRSLRELFDTYHWPGNVRELSSTILRLMIGDDPESVEADLCKNMKGDDSPLPEGPAREGAPDSPISLGELKTRATRDIERRVILYALHMARWNKREAARMLKISYKALFNKLNAYGIGHNRAGTGGG